MAGGSRPKTAHQRNSDLGASSEHMRSSPPRFLDDAEASSPASSEPALFSSDGPMENAGLDNYEHPRKKRKYTNLWDTRAPEPTKKSKLSRNIDSGVWLHSDESHDDNAAHDLPTSPKPMFGLDGTSDQFDGPGDQLPPYVGNATRGFADIQSPSTLSEFQVDQLPLPEYLAHHIIEKGLAAPYCESYDLSDINLEDSHLEPLSRLSTLIKPPLNFGPSVPGEEYYRSMHPSIFLNLGKNMLCHTSPSLFCLEHLTSLLLPDNKISELPPQIGQLKNLTLLDVRNNRLESLPPELLDLLTPCPTLKRLTTSGNPLREKGPDPRDVMNADNTNQNTLPGSHLERMQRIQEMAKNPPESVNPQAALWVLHTLEQLEAGFGYDALNHERGFPMCLIPKLIETTRPRETDFTGNTPPSYYDESGRVVPGSPAQSSMTCEDVVIKTKSGTWWHGPPSGVKPQDNWSGWFSRPDSPTAEIPSLFLLAAKTALEHLSPTEARAMMGNHYGDIPQFDTICGAAARNRESVFDGFRNCYQCGKRFVVPRAEWLEFWYLAGDFLPFRVQVCSWRCVPDSVAEL
ncbi:hypothetical protein BCR34DRAFT_587948 [Clohesyomyces aquaticus]|uniref:Uncharacterized protein n=1 Tax=Clohesyomyces aquaticus TaxID=1231657 RepID=A0A1Y1ZMN8_9PLEO|nr:hypothetical protein BCR34DRAFT_587948 [Clohesyomyces aquaticus]